MNLMHRLFLLLLTLLFASCVTAQDLRDVADSVERMETTLDDTTSSPEEVQLAIATAKTEIVAKAEEIEERSEGFLETLGSAEGGVAGVLSLAAMTALHLFRNRQRVVRGEPVGAPPKPT